jgi:uncharacterized membrane protein
MGREPVLWMSLIMGIILVAKEVLAQFGMALTPSLTVAVDGLVVAAVAFITRKQVTPNQSVAVRVDEHVNVKP